MKTILSSAKKHFFLVVSLPILYLALSFNTMKKKECNPQELLAIGVDKLKSYSLVKHYPFSFKEKKKNKPAEALTQTITLTRGVKYRFFSIPNSQFEGKPVIAIYNNEKQEILVATTYNKSIQKLYDEITFECKTTGNYCLSFSFLDGLEGCAVGMMAFLDKS